MVIPTLEEFEQVLACINKEIEPDLLEDAKELEVAIKPPRSRNPPTVLPDKEALRRLLTKVAEYRRCRIAAIEKSPAMRWFLGQPGALKARISIYGRKTLTGSSEQEDLIHDENYLLESFRDVTVEDVQAFRAKYSRWEKRLRTDEDVLNEVHSSNVPFTKWRRFTSSLRRVMSRFPYVWEGGVLAALCNYFYTDYWKQYYDEVRSRESDLKAALKGLEALQRLGEFHSAPYEVVDISDKYDWVYKLRKKISAELNATLQAPYPIQRNDATAKERALVFELYRNNLETVRSKKLKVICDLMYLEGITNPLGARTIERLVSNWYLSEREWRSWKYDS